MQNQQLSFLTLMLLLCQNGVYPVNIITCHGEVAHLSCQGITYKKQITCESKTALLSCSTQEGTIKVLSANYGRTNSFICSTGKPANQLSNIQCIQTTTLSKMVEKCNGKQFCVVPASNSVFGDPCVGTYKYLMLTYSCVPKDPHVIKVLSANYGRTDSVSCSSGRPASQLSNIQCIQSSSLSVMASQCNGNQNCLVSANHLVFGDPCFGTYKYLNVTYNCVKWVLGEPASISFPLPSPE